MIEKNGVRIAFLGYCSVLLPQYWATEDRAGCAPIVRTHFTSRYKFQPGSPGASSPCRTRKTCGSLLEDVRKAKQAADVVVLSMHWGLHYIPKPHDYQTIVAHAAIDAGVSLILGHHPHQQQAIEVHKGAVIFYSLGNFAMYRRKGGHAYCMPNGEYTHGEVYWVSRIREFISITSGTAMKAALLISNSIARACGARRICPCC